MYLEQVAKEIEECNFLGIQADETTDVSCKCPVVFILRYVHGGEVKERFISFVEAKEKHADALTNILNSVLEKYNVKDKLIAQTYDGAATIKGRIKGASKHKYVRNTPMHTSCILFATLTS